jgi:hypothetical protein
MVAARISDLPSRLGATAALLAALPDVSIDLHSASGIAIVSLRAAEPSTLRALVRLAPSDGCLAWLRMPESLAGDPALARPAREDSVLQHAIKTAIDPLGTFSPGRSVPGL